MKFEPLVKSENHELFLINDNSKIETEKIKSKENMVKK